MTSWGLSSRRRLVQGSLVRSGCTTIAPRTGESFSNMSRPSGLCWALGLGYCLGDKVTRVFPARGVHEGVLEASCSRSVQKRSS